MNELDQIKLQVAKDNHFCDWKELLTCCTTDMIDQHWTTVAIKFANQHRRSFPVATIGHIDHGRTTLGAAAIAALNERGVDVVVLGQLDHEPSLKPMSEIINKIEFEKVFMTPHNFDPPKSKYHK